MPIPMKQERLESALFDLMLAVSEQFSAWESIQALIRPEGLRLPDSRIQRALSYIGEHLGLPLVADRLAASAHLSRAQFFVRFRRCTGMTLHVYVNTLRAAPPVGGWRRRTIEPASGASRKTWVFPTSAVLLHCSVSKGPETTSGYVKSQLCAHLIRSPTPPHAPRLAW